MVSYERVTFLISNANCSIMLLEGASNLLIGRGQIIITGASDSILSNMDEQMLINYDC